MDHVVISDTLRVILFVVYFIRKKIPTLFNFYLNLQSMTSLHLHWLYQNTRSIRFAPHLRLRMVFLATFCFIYGFTQVFMVTLRTSK